MSRTRIAARIVIPVVLLVGLGGALLAYRSSAKSAPALTTGTVSRGDIVQAIAASGTLEAVTTVEVGTQVSGTIKDLLADYNDVVRRGQVLARLDPSLFEAQVEQANAALVKAEADAERLRVALDDARAKLSRAKALAARSLLAAADLDAASIDERGAGAELAAANAVVTQARASLNQAKVSLGHTIITAPIDGIVISRAVDAGQTVAASMSAPTIFVIAADLTRMRVIAKLDESDIAKVRDGAAVSFHVDAYPGETFAGRVSQVRLQGETTSNVVTYTTVIDVANAEFRLKPGMTATVSVLVRQVEDVLRVPSGALRVRPTVEQLALLGIPGAASKSPTKGTGVVWRFDGQHVEPVAVQPGITDGVATELVSGSLKEGDRIVLAFSAPSASSKSGGTNATQANPLMGQQMPGPPPPR